ncbi:MAG: hypothetical protein E6H58_16530 [Betaproteobacteria bacterium]|jgi:hypothetical protein|nr:MAG: hypothetical protein E6H58_16530 [Betaproteobacteria bacterium]
MRSLLIAGVVLVVCVLAWSLRPVCVPLSAEELRSFNVPIEQRTDRDIYLKVFQRQGEQWVQCKTWMSRQLFF